MMNLIKVIILCSAFSIFSAFALTVDEGKNQGLIGETFSGYLAVVDPNNSEARVLIEQINAERKAKYDEIARKNNLKTNDVAKLAGQKLVDRADKGEYVRGINGQWVKKK
ncbi:YdbL family probable chaperone protein [Providencia rustigianii]|uniref:YdbL family protein n=1 Tax=Providencia rustigianii TaxID=158850 RepID=UPI002244CB75|nr:YdbL family protein [Providencia rustigianii]